MARVFLMCIILVSEYKNSIFSSYRAMMLFAAGSFKRIAFSYCTGGLRMQISAEALDFLKACESFIAFLERTEPSEIDREMGLFYVQQLNEKLSPRWTEGERFAA
jgi:hypothetical protein